MKRSSMASRFLGLPVALAALSGAVLQGQTTIPSTFVQPSSAADTTKPGFIWRVHQVASGQPNTLAFTEDQLAGLKGDNLADPAAQGIAIAPGTPGPTSKDPISFDIATVINLDQSAAGGGNFTPNDQMPGIPGTTQSTDNIAAEVFTWLELPVGEVVMGVNSDDGFRVLIGGATPPDRFAVNVGECDCGRGAADTIFRFNITQAGLYAARLIWEEGGGGAEVEWFTVKADGTKVLVNDTANGGIRAFRAVTSPARAVATKVSPSPGAQNVSSASTVALELTDGGTPVNPATARLILDGAEVQTNPPKSGGVIRASYTPATRFAPASVHTASFIYTEGTTAITNTWTFTVNDYKTIPATAKVTPDTTKPGFLWNVFANAGDQQTTLAKTELALTGQLKDAQGSLIPNNADPNGVGAAIAAAAPPNPANGLVKFEIAGVINFSQDSVLEGANGNFTPDQQMPGVPATDASTDGVAAEIITYLELPAGLITMGVNSDDGFRVYGGQYYDAFGRLNLGQFDGGRGAADTIFEFVVQEAGVYPFRAIWQEGGGGANIEWFTVTASGVKVLVGDVAGGGVKAYRAQTSPVPPHIASVTPEPAVRQLNGVSSSLSIILRDGTGTATLNDNSIALTIDGNAVTGLSKVRSGNQVTVSVSPAGLLVPADAYALSISFRDATGSYTRNQQWQTRNLKNLVLPTPKILETFDSYPEDSQPTGWVAKNFTARNGTARDITDQQSLSYEDWVLVNVGNIGSIDGGRPFNITPGQFYNGIEIKNGDPVGGVFPEWIMSGNVLYAESDSRSNTDSEGRPYVGQTQFITSKAFDCSQITNVVLTFSSIYEQNQDSLGAVEYSVDGGATWMPVMYFLEEPDIKLNADGTVNAVRTFTDANADTSSWVDNGVQKGGKYGDGLAAPITAALGDYVVPRVNDGQVEGKRIEVVRLAQAGKKSDVRLRFAQLGTDSWYFAVDNIAFYEDPNPRTSAAQPRITGTTLAGGQITITWENGGTLEWAPALPATTWTSTGDSDGSFSEAATGTRFYRIRK